MSEDFKIPESDLEEVQTAEDLDRFTLTAGQLAALVHILNFMPKSTTGCQVGIVEGYAGTGKTTLIRTIARDNPSAFVLTPTGKAAVRVMEVAGCDAMTIHRWLYKPIMDGTSGEISDWQLKTGMEIGRPLNNILIVDEASMVNRTIFDDLIRVCEPLGINIVFIGDGYQLPPVEKFGTSEFSVFAKNTPYAWKVVLTEVVRQAMDSPVLAAATIIRSGGSIYEAFGKLEIIPKDQMDDEVRRLYKAGGAAICHKNQTRHDMNERIRKSLGYTENWAQKGEPVMVVKNNYDLNVFNGEVYKLTDDTTRYVAEVEVMNYTTHKSRRFSAQKVWFEGIERPIMLCRDQMFGANSKDFSDSNIDGGFKKWLRKQKWLNQDSEEWRLESPIHAGANFGYVLTAHKAQGSEWPEVLVIMENSINPEWGDGRKWLYTAITRASQKVKIVYND